MLDFVEIMNVEEIPIEDQYIQVWVGQVIPKEANELLQILSERLPLERLHLQHLKRIRREKHNNKTFTLEVIICPEKDIEFVDINLLNRFQNKRLALLSKYEPRNRKEFEEWGISWPILFRPNDVDREREKGLHSDLKIKMNHYCNLVKEDCEKVKDILIEANVNDVVSLHGAIMVNPVTDQVVMTCSKALEIGVQTYGTAILHHPLYSPTMLVIAGIAAVSRHEISPLADLPREQYLCTGLHLYLLEEPDMTSSMALVHSRILSVIYQISDSSAGGLGSLYKLHTLRTINHRFRVFRTATTL